MDEQEKRLESRLKKRLEEINTQDTVKHAVGHSHKIITRQQPCPKCGAHAALLVGASGEEQTVSCLQCKGALAVRPILSEVRRRIAALSDAEHGLPTFDAQLYGNKRALLDLAEWLESNEPAPQSLALYRDAVLEEAVKTLEAHSEQTRQLFGSAATAREATVIIEAVAMIRQLKTKRR